MLARSGLLAALLLTSAASGAEFDANDRIFKLLKPSQILRFIPSNEKAEIDSIYSLQPDCTPSGRISFRIVRPPLHGDLTADYVDGFSDYGERNTRAHCNGAKSPGLAYFYKPAADYVGDDGAEVLTIFPDGSADLYHYDLVVR